MSDIKKENIQQEVFDLYDDYAHNRVSRRDFVQKLSIYAVGGLTVTSLMSFLMPDYKGTYRQRPTIQNLNQNTFIMIRQRVAEA